MAILCLTEEPIAKILQNNKRTFIQNGTMLAVCTGVASLSKVLLRNHCTVYVLCTLHVCLAWINGDLGCDLDLGQSLNLEIMTP